MNKEKMVMSALLMLTLAAWKSLPAQTPQEAGGAFVREYKIGPRDLLEIRVIDLPELSKFEVRVSEDGTVKLPLLGNVPVSGITKDAVERLLATLLQEKVMKNPQVSVFIREYQSNRVALIGAVMKPGMYDLVGRMNLLQAISEAGGLKDNAANEVFVLREEKDGSTASIRIDLEDLMVNGKPELNIPLQANDTVNIPVDRIINIYVFGEVRNPGALQVKTSQKITLFKAITQAGGLTENAAKSGIRIKRTNKQGKEETQTVSLRDIIRGKKPDIPLREGDVVIVPESIF
jgi:polysaccharide export outer membrane protein